MPMTCCLPAPAMQINSQSVLAQRSSSPCPPAQLTERAQVARSSVLRCNEPGCTSEGRRLIRMKYREYAPLSSGHNWGGETGPLPRAGVRGGAGEGGRRRARRRLEGERGGGERTKEGTSVYGEDRCLRRLLNALLDGEPRPFAADEWKEETTTMEMLMLLFKSGLEFDEIVKASETRENQYRQVKGLIQKYYVQDHSTGHTGGVFVFDSKEALKAFKESDLAKSTAEVYKFTEPPYMRVLKVAKTLHK